MKTNQKKKQKELLAEEVIDIALGRVENSRLVIASSFSLEAVSIFHMIASRNASVRFVSLDTGRLHEETYATMEAIRHRYGIEIEVFSPKAEEVEELVRKEGLFSFRESLEARKRCCFVRKIQPLERALKDADGWVCGLRRTHTQKRETIEKIERDEKHGGIWKFNPIADWTFEDVKDFVRKNGIPYNKLYDKGFQSIGCEPCTRAVKDGEDERAGRWWWEDSEHKECGIHFLPTLELK